MPAARAGEDRNYLKGERDIHEEDLGFQESVMKEYLSLQQYVDDLELIDCTDGMGNMQSPVAISELIIKQFGYRKMKYLKLLSRILLGIVFIFSGFVKAVDPLGSAYKFADYFTAFRIGFPGVQCTSPGHWLAAFELVLGIALILGYRRKMVYTILLWFMLFFTVLTFILAIFNPVSDCGCFGDALILTNWQTFLKNVVLMIFVALLFFGRKTDQVSGHPQKEWFILAGIYADAYTFLGLEFPASSPDRFQAL